MKKIIIFLLLLCSLHILHAQGNDTDIFKNVETTHQLLKALETSPGVDSLKQILAADISDKDRAIILFKLTTSYLDNELDSSLKYIQQFNQIQSKTKQLEANGLVIMGSILFGRLGNPSMAIEIQFKGLNILEQMNDSAGIGMAYWNIGKIYQSVDNSTEAIAYYLRALKIAAAAHEPVPLSYSMGFLGLHIYEIR